MACSGLRAAAWLCESWRLQSVREQLRVCSMRRREEEEETKAQKPNVSSWNMIIYDTDSSSFHLYNNKWWILYGHVAFFVALMSRPDPCRGQTVILNDHTPHVFIPWHTSGCRLHLWFIYVVLSSLFMLLLLHNSLWSWEMNWGTVEQTSQESTSTTSLALLSGWGSVKLLQLCLLTQIFKKLFSICRKLRTELLHCPFKYNGGRKTVFYAFILEEKGVSFLHPITIQFLIMILTSVLFKIIILFMYFYCIFLITQMSAGL